MRELERARRRTIDPEVIDDVRAKIGGGAGGERAATFVVKHVRARRLRRAVDERRVELRRQHGTGEKLGDR